MYKKLLLIFLALVLIIVGVSALYSKRNANKANFELTLAPSSAEAVLDGSKKIGQGKTYLAPGSHSLKVSMEGFADKTVSFTTVSGKVTSETIVLVPNSSVGTAWLQSHTDEELRRESLGGQAYDQTVSQVQKTLPLVSELPFVDQLYRVDYGPSQKNPNDKNAIAIYIKYYSEQGKQQALDWLKFKGYNPSTLEIIYQNASP